MLGIITLQTLIEFHGRFLLPIFQTNVVTGILMPQLANHWLIAPVKLFKTGFILVTLHLVN